MSDIISKPFLGLSLQGDQFCLVRMEQGSIQAIATRELVQPFEMGAFQDDGKLLKNYIEIVRDLYGRSGGRGKDVGISLNSDLVLTKRIPVALGLNEDMINEHLKWEVEQFLIDSIDEYVFEYQKLPFQTAEGNPIFLSILVRKKIIEGLRTLIKACDLTLKDVDVDVFSIVRALLANYDLDASGTAVLVDIQRDGISFIFIRQKEYYFSHRIPFNDTRAVSRSMDNSAILQLIQKELKRLVFGHNLGRRIEDLNAIYFIGNEAVQSISEELSGTVNVPQEIVNPFRRVAVSESVSQSQEFSRFPEKFVPSVGVTLKHVPEFSRN
jgi:Tfp pilus assembly PilM family ATPase